MVITDVRIKLIQAEGKLLAFGSLTIDHNFVVHDLKVIAGDSGLFVAMPNRKIATHCPKCKCKNHLRANYCNDCGDRLDPPTEADGKQKLYADIAHPINAGCRQQIQYCVLKEYELELEAAKSPDYVSKYDEDFCID